MRFKVEEMHKILLSRLVVIINSLGNSVFLNFS